MSPIRRIGMASLACLWLGLGCAPDPQAGPDAADTAGVLDAADAGPDADPVDVTPDGAPGDIATDADVDADMGDGIPNPDGTDIGDGTDAADTIDPGPQLEVGDDACCISFSETKAVWAELEYTEDATCVTEGVCFDTGCKEGLDALGSPVCRRMTGGAVWIFDRETGVKSRLDSGPGATGIQKDPMISGDRVVWADNRNGTDYDLWVHDLKTGISSVLVGDAGDQDEPAIDGDLLVWVGRTKAPYGPAEREIWTMKVGSIGTKRQLTDDAAEQTQPHCSGARIVWTDYGADPDGVYEPGSDPTTNNGDIQGYDLATDTAFTVTTDLSKQVRPAIAGEFVVWMDWRGINPEPKYSEFKVFGAKLGSDIVAPIEHSLAWSAWQRPSLWQRPTVNAEGLAGWIQEGAKGERSAVYVAAIEADAVATELLGVPTQFLEGVQFLSDQIGYMGAGKIGWLSLDGIESPLPEAQPAP